MQAIVISAAGNHEQHSHNTEESCTPFCTCSCCAAPVFFVSYSKMQVNKALFQTQKYSLYNIALNTEVYYSIWQPPKIA
jgi:hypothetical protein